MIKIENLIELCTDCRFCTKAYRLNASKANFLICEFPNKDPFVIDSTESEEVRNFEHKIPDNCPLETYNQPKTDSV